MVLFHFILIRCILAQPYQDHIVSIHEVQNQISSQSFKRIENIRDIQKLLRHSEVQKQLGDLIDLRKIETAVAGLDDKTLEDLARRGRIVNDQLQAGAVDKKYQGIIAMVVLVVVITVVILTSPAFK